MSARQKEKQIARWMREKDGFILNLRIVHTCSYAQASSVALTQFSMELQVVNETSAPAFSMGPVRQA